MLIRASALAPRSLQTRLQSLLRSADVDLTLAPAAATWAIVEQDDWDLVLTARERLGRAAAERVRSLRARPLPPDIIVLSKGEDAHDRAALLAAGAVAVINTGLSDAALVDALATLIDRCRETRRHRLRAERADSRGSLADFVSESPSMQRFIAIAQRVVLADTSLLILGETGVGKERLARAMHDEGPRQAGPFIAVNCGALSETLLESELFGHREGAFTGAVRARRGYFELAHGGTLLLDEVGEMPLTLQVKVLRALQERSIMPVGGEREISVDVRVIAATNRDLQREVLDGRFRADLFYRLSVITLLIPPLRERSSDIPLLVDNHLQSLGRLGRRQPRHISATAMGALTRHAWPGNVRELINVLERAALLCDGDSIGLADLPETIAGGTGARPTAVPTPRTAATTVPLATALAGVTAAFERDYLADVLTDTRGRIGEAARRAGISERALYAKMRRHGLDKAAFKPPAQPAAP